MQPDRMRVVLLPGLDGTGLLSHEIATALRVRELPCEVIDYPRDRVLDHAALAAHACARLPDGPFVLLGESFSGPVATLIAARRPAALRGLVLSTSFVRHAIPALAWAAPLTRILPARPPRWLMSWWLLGRWATPALEHRLQDATRAVAPDVLRARAGMSLTVDASDAAREIRVPVMQLRATHDRLLPRSAAAITRASIPQAVTVDIDGPHLLLQTATAACADRVAWFVRTLEH